MKQAALPLGLPVLQPATLRGENAPTELAALEPDVIVVAAYGRLLPPVVLSIAPHGCLNLHPSLLPRHRGPSPVATAILEGDEVTGTSLMLLDEGMDTGPVLARREFPLQGIETAGALTERLFVLGAELLRDTLPSWVAGRLAAEPQDGALATLTRKLERSDGWADWSLSAEMLARQCRAYSPWPGLYTEWDGRVLKLLEVHAIHGQEGPLSSPGSVTVPANGPALHVATGDGILSLERLQLEGRRAVDAAEFLRGYQAIAGASLGAQ